MNSKLFIFVFISLMCGVASYIATENLFIAIGVLVIYLAISLFMLVPRLKKYEIEKNKFHECYHFINNFIISLSIKKSIAGALETTVGSMPSEFVDMFNNLENMSENDKLNYLSTYFNFYDYYLFLQIVMLWEEQGGDIIAMSKYLSNDIRLNEEYLTKTEGLSRHKYFEIGVLWVITVAIIIVLRFALKDFYERIKTQLMYLISIGVVMLFMLFSIYLLIVRATHLEIKGGDKNEKNA